MKPPTPFLEVVSNGADADPEMDQLLGAARVSADPLPENRERVSRALGAALPVSLGTLSPLVASEAPPAASGPGPAAAPRLRVGTAPNAAWLGAGGVLVGGLLLGVLGFWLGHDLGYSKGVAHALREQLGQVAARELATPSPPAAAHPEPSASASQSTAPLATEPPAPPGPTAEHTAVAPRKRARAAAAPSSRPSRSASAAEPAAPTTLTFRQVLEQLRRAQQQLRNGQAAMALLVLSELDRAAGELLVEEREATRVLALCAAGQDKAARAAARRLEQSSPGSIYAMRVSTSCAGADAALESSADATGDEWLGDESKR